MRNPSSSSSSAGGKTKTTTPCCSKVGIKRGPWTPEEDVVLANFVKNEGEGQWRTLPKKAGLLRCGKSCRLRWMNYLRPSVKRGRIAPDEEDLILRLHRLLGNRWSLIAGRIPGRTDNEIKNYWNTHLSKKLISQGIDPRTHKPLNANPNSPKIPQDSGPISAPLEETGPPYRVIATKVSQNFSMMTYQAHEQYQNPITNEWPGCECLFMGLQNAEEQSNAAYFIENGNANEDIFTSFLDSLINENDNLLINHHHQQQQQQLQLQQQQQQLKVIEPSVRPINVSAPQAFNNAAVWEGGVLSSTAALGDEDVALS